MPKTVRGVLENPTLLRLDEPVELPLHVSVEVTIREVSLEERPASKFLQLMQTLQVEGEADFSERWEEYVLADEQERAHLRPPE
jgi:hypothetical protein